MTTSVAPRAEKVSEVVARSIVQDIAPRDLQPGTMLPPESVMLERYRVGRASLREGLRILEIQGLITIKPGPGGGPVVGQANSRDFGRMATLHYQAVGATFRELVEARLIIEPLMAGLAAATRNRQLLDELRIMSDRTREGLQDDFEYSSSASDFHGAMAGASGNRILDLFGKSLKDVYSERIRSSFIFPLEAAPACPGGPRGDHRRDRGRRRRQGPQAHDRAHGGVRRVRRRALPRADGRGRRLALTGSRRLARYPSNHCYD